jgi:hypothetical protein
MRQAACIRGWTTAGTAQRYFQPKVKACKLRIDEIDADGDEIYTSTWWTTNAAAEKVRDVRRYSGLTALRSMGYREAIT